MSPKYLCMLFGITPSSCSWILNKMLLLVVEKLKRHAMVRVKFLNDEKKKKFTAMIQRREPAVDDIMDFMDGVSFMS